MNEKKRQKMMKERVDVFDESGEKTGETASLLEVHEKGIWHQTAHVWIWDGEGKILLQKRAEGKPNWPGFWDISAAGHIDAGEEVLDGALREAEEELGVRFGKEDLEKIGVVKANMKIPNSEWVEKEWQTVYLVKWGGKIEEMKIEEEEVEELKWVDLAEFWEMIKDFEKAKLVPHTTEMEFLKKSLKSEK